MYLFIDIFYTLSQKEPIFRLKLNIYDETHSADLYLYFFILQKSEIGVQLGFF